MRISNLAFAVAAGTAAATRLNDQANFTNSSSITPELNDQANFTSSYLGLSELNDQANSSNSTFYARMEKAANSRGYAITSTAIDVIGLEEVFDLASIIALCFVGCCRRNQGGGEANQPEREVVQDDNYNQQNEVVQVVQVENGDDDNYSAQGNNGGSEYDNYEPGVNDGYAQLSMHFNSAGAESVMDINNIAVYN